MDIFCGNIDEVYAEAEPVMIHNERDVGDNNGTGYEVLIPIEECNRTGTYKHIPIEEDILKIMKVIDIWKELKESNILVTGNKTKLVSRLRKCLSYKVQQEWINQIEQKKSINLLAADFLITSFWKPLVALEDIVVEQKNP